jgi:hypothetical protein
VLKSAEKIVDFDKRDFGYNRGMKKVMFPLFEKVEELTLRSDFRKCGSCGAFIKDGFGCKHMFPNAKCWFPVGSIQVEDEVEEK